MLLANWTVLEFMKIDTSFFLVTGYLLVTLFFYMYLNLTFLFSLFTWLCQICRHFVAFVENAERELHVNLTFSTRGAKYLNTHTQRSSENVCAQKYVSCLCCVLHFLHSRTWFERWIRLVFSWICWVFLGFSRFLMNWNWTAVILKTSWSYKLKELQRFQMNYEHEEWFRFF